MSPRRVLAFSLGVLSAVAGAFFFIGNAFSAFDDFKNPGVTFWGAVLGVAISWSLPAVAFYMAYRLIREAVSLKVKGQVPRFARDDNRAGDRP